MAGDKDQGAAPEAPVQASESTEKSSESVERGAAQHASAEVAATEQVSPEARKEGWKDDTARCQELGQVPALTIDGCQSKADGSAEADPSKAGTEGSDDKQKSPESKDAKKDPYAAEGADADASPEQKNQSQNGIKEGQVPTQGSDASTEPHKHKAQNGEEAKVPTPGADATSEPHKHKSQNGVEAEEAHKHKAQNGVEAVPAKGPDAKLDPTTAPDGTDAEPAKKSIDSKSPVLGQATEDKLNPTTAPDGTDAEPAKRSIDSKSPVGRQATEEKLDPTTAPDGTDAEPAKKPGVEAKIDPEAVPAEGPDAAAPKEEQKAVDAAQEVTPEASQKAPAAEKHPLEGLKVPAFGRKGPIDSVNKAARENEALKNLSPQERVDLARSLRDEAIDNAKARGENRKGSADLKGTDSTEITPNVLKRMDAYKAQREGRTVPAPEAQDKPAAPDKAVVPDSSSEQGKGRSDQDKPAPSEQDKAAQAEKEKAEQAEKEKAAQAEKERVEQAEKEKAEQAEKDKAAQAEKERAEQAEKDKAAQAEKERAEQAEKEKAVPDKASPEQAAPEEAEKVAPEKVAPEKVAPEKAAPEGAAPEKGKGLEKGSAPEVLEVSSKYPELNVEGRTPDKVVKGGYATGYGFKGDATGGGPNGFRSPGDPIKGSPVHGPRHELYSIQQVLDGKAPYASVALDTKLMNNLWSKGDHNLAHAPTVVSQDLDEKYKDFLAEKGLKHFPLKGMNTGPAIQGNDIDFKVRSRSDASEITGSHNYEVYSNDPKVLARKGKSTK